MFSQYGIKKKKKVLKCCGCLVWDSFQKGQYAESAKNMHCVWLKILKKWWKLKKTPQHNNLKELLL